MSSENGVLSKPLMFGKYCLLERISVGGMAEVFKAKQFGVEGFERLLAVKRILDTIAEDEVFIKMFIDEAKIAGQLNHPNIAQIFDLGKVDGSYFIALEYISGKDLRTIWERLSSHSEPSDIFMPCHVTMKVCEALQYAHTKKDAAGNELDIVHRDISPQNVLLSYEGDVKIIDFGIAKAQGKTSQTQVGILKGKFSYMSPEQVRGLPVDHRADLFSLGIVLYELLTHKRLFLGESDFDTLEKIRKVEMSPPTLYNPHIPLELEEIVLKSLHKNPDERYQSASEFHDALERFMRNQSSYYGAKDLAELMKAIFAQEIELERQRLDYYRTVNMDSLGAKAEPEAPFGEDPETQIYPRQDMPDFDQISPVSEANISKGEGSGPTPSQGGMYAEGPLAFGNSGPVERLTQAAPGEALLAASAAASLPGANKARMDNDDDPTIEWERIDVGELARGGSVGQVAPPPSPDVASSSGAPSLSPPASLRPPGSSSSGPSVPPEPSLGPPPVGRARPGQYSARQDESPSLLAPRQAHRSGTGMILALVALILVVVVGALSLVYFLPRLSEADKVQLRLKVADAENISVTIDNKVAYNGPNQETIIITDLDAGEHRVMVSAKGYEPVSDTLVLQPGVDYDIPIRLKPAVTGDATGLLVKVVPSDVTITINGAKVQESPPFTRRDLKAGKAVLIFKKDKYLDEVREVTVKEGQIETVDVAMRPERVKLEVSSPVAGAAVSVYARNAEGDQARELVKSGKVPLSLPDLDARKVYDVEVSKDGYKAWKQTFKPGAELSEALTATLEEDEAAVADAKAPEEVKKPLSDAERDALAERRRAAAELKARRDEALAARGGAKPDPRDARATPPVAKETPKAKAPVDNSPGYVAIISKPPARVILDGRDIGYTPKPKVQLAPGPHRAVLKIESAGVTKTYNFTIKPNATHFIKARP